MPARQASRVALQNACLPAHKASHDPMGPPLALPLQRSSRRPAQWWLPPSCPRRVGRSPPQAPRLPPQPPAEPRPGKVYKRPGVRMPLAPAKQVPLCSGHGAQHRGQTVLPGWPSALVIMHCRGAPPSVVAQRARHAHLLGGFLLRLVVVEDDAAVLRAHVVALAVERGGVHFLHPGEW